MRYPSITSPHGHGPNSVAKTMLWVILALIPGSLAMIWYFGWGVLVNILLASATAVACEALALQLRGRPIGPVLADMSAVVTALLFALTVPPLLPWWMTVLGVAFAILVVKQLYGGIGYNPFNPAMAGYVVLLISFPLELTLWSAPGAQLGFSDALIQVFTGALPADQTLDTLTMATPMDNIKTRLGLSETLSEIHGSPLFGDFAGAGWEWINLWFLLGGLWLLQMKVIQWHIPVGMLGGMACIAFVFYAINPDVFTTPLFQLFSGAAMLGAFFIATDPVSACTTPRGRLYYGLGIGLLTYIIRTWGGYPDGVAFAVLLMNMAAPTIDHYTRPRVFGHDK